MTKATYDEAMEALDDGRVIRCSEVGMNSYYFRVDNGVSSYVYGDTFSKEWGNVWWDNDIADCYRFWILPEYYLTFAEAMMVVQRGGKVVDDEGGAISGSCDRVKSVGKHDGVTLRSIDEWALRKFKEVFEGE